MRSTIICILIGATIARRNLTFAICWKHGIFMFLGYVLGCWSMSFVGGLTRVGVLWLGVLRRLLGKCLWILDA
jgi:hypothetical protein